jgi:hypothetical protein
MREIRLAGMAKLAFVHFSAKSVSIAQNITQRAKRHCARNTERRRIVCSHMIGQIINQRTVWFQNKRGYAFLSFNRKMLFYPAIETVPWLV